MSILTELKQAAVEVANNLQQRRSGLEAKKQNLETQLAQVQAQLDASSLPYQRVANFQPQIGADFQCPSCWVQNECRSALMPVPSETDDDILRCRTCHQDFSIPN